MQPALETSVSYWRRLLHRWLIQYNPLYLLSACLVLGGVTLLSRGLAAGADHAEQLGVATVAEVYAWALVGGAALLNRIGLRRPAVMLALLTALYQCDVTLHAETSMYLGWPGAAGAVVWFVSFVAKMYVLGLAVRVKIARSAYRILMLGGAGVLILPRLWLVLGPDGLSQASALWLFALFAGALWSKHAVESNVELDAWAKTVLARSVLAIWLIFAAGALGHVVFWSAKFDVLLGIFAPLAFLLATRWIKNELATWIMVSGTVALVAAKSPLLLSTVSLMAAATLALRALQKPSWPEPFVPVPAPSGPYRAPIAPPTQGVEFEVGFALAGEAERMRLLTGSLFGVYLAIWTFGWSKWPWPDHVVALDLVLALAVLILAWKARMRIALTPLGATYAHYVLALRLVPKPRTLFEWGSISVGAGFAVLVASLGYSYWFVKRGVLEPNRTAE